MLDPCIVMTQKRVQITSSGNTAIMNFIGGVSEDSETNNAEYVTQRVTELLKAGIRNVEGYINTKGGDVFEANEIKNQIKRFPGSRSATTGAICGSAGTMILMAFEKDKTKISANGYLMYHDLAVSQGGTIADMKTKIDLMANLTEDYLNDLMEWTGKPKEVLRAMLSSTTWLNAEKAVTEGFIGSKVEATKDLSILNSIDRNQYKNLPTDLITALVSQEEIITKLNNPMYTVEAKTTLSSVVPGITASSTNEEVTAAIKTLADKSKNTDALVASAKIEATKAANTIVATMIVDMAVTNKQITESEKPQWLVDATANPEMAARMLSKIPTPIKASGTVVVGGASDATVTDKSKWTLKDWMENDAAGTIEMREKDPAKYKALYKAHYNRECEIG